MELLYWYATPAFIALAIKIWLLVNSNKRKLIIRNWPLALFFLSVSIFNIVEVATYTASFSPVFYSIFIKLYNGSILLSLCFLMIFSGIIAEIKIFKHSNFSIYYSIFGFAFFIAFISTDYFISGYEVVGYGFTRIPGEYFQISVLFALINLVASFVFMVFGFLRKNIQQKNKRKCKVILFSYFPFMISVIIIIFLMHIGVKITGEIIVPLTIPCLLLILVLAESEKDLFKFLLKTPCTQEHKTLKK